MESREVKILCYADDVVLIAENGDAFQMLLYTLNAVVEHSG